MQTLIIILFILAFLSLTLQLSLIEKKFSTIIFYVLAVVILYFLYPYAIEQSYAKFKSLIQNAHIMSNIMVLQIVECLLGLLFSIFLIRTYYKERVYKFFKFFNYFPGLIIFPAIFYAESAVFLNISGMDFQFLAIMIALVLPAIIIGMKIIIKFLIPEYDLRLELKFILHILQLVTAVIISINLFKLPTANVVSDFHISQLLVFFGLVLVFGMVGVGRYYWVMRKRSE